MSSIESVPYDKRPQEPKGTLKQKPTTSSLALSQKINLNKVGHLQWVRKVFRSFIMFTLRASQGLNTFDDVIFQFFFFNRFAKMSTFLFFSVKMGC